MLQSDKSAAIVPLRKHQSELVDSKQRNEAPMLGTHHVKTPDRFDRDEPCKLNVHQPSRCHSSAGSVSILSDLSMEMNDEIANDGKACT